MKRLSAVTLFFATAFSMALSSNGVAQSPTPMIVQAANSAAAATSTTSRTATAPDDLQSLAAAIKGLEQIKAANEDVLAKQKAALEKLDELKENADQLQIFAKRG
jgi:shikimate 5-dehydrogenase